MEQKKYTYDYPMASITADVAVLKETPTVDKVLLIKRKNEPYKDCWAFPGGFMEMSESLADCASRELKEETGIFVPADNLYFVTMLDGVDRDPRGRTLSASFACFVSADTEAVASDDAKEAKWFPIDQLPELAFDHAKVIEILLNDMYI